MKTDNLAGARNAGNHSPAATLPAGAESENSGIAKLHKHMHTRIKICGLTRVQDAVAACNFGADAIGLVFYPPSSRNITVEQASEILRGVPPFVTVVGLFLNAQQSVVEKILQRLPLSMLQFHGTESPEYCESFQIPYIKSVAMKSVVNVHEYTAEYASARGFLLDSNLAGAAGGSGETFDWSAIPAKLASPVILAGGLDKGNVNQAVVNVKPAAVDVSSGVESAPGIKDHSLMHEFISQVRDADRAGNHQLANGDQ